jgi:hypothetical protein
MTKMQSVGNFDLSRLTWLGWLVALLSIGVGAGCMVALNALMGPDAPAAGANRRARFPALIALAGGAGFFFVCKAALDALGMPIIRPLAGRDIDQFVEGNAPILADLRRRQARTRSLYRFFFWLMPVGALAPCLVATALPDDASRTAFGVAAFVLPIVGFAGTLLMRGDRKMYDRRVALAEQADGWGLLFIENPEEKLFGRLNACDSFHDVLSHDARNMALGTYRGVTVTALDYQTLQRGALGSYPGNQTVVFLPDALPNVPNFQLLQRGWFSKASSNAPAGATEVNLRGEEQFHQAYVLLSDQPNQVAALFTSALTAWCLSRQAAQVEVHEGSLLLFRKNTQLDVKGVAALLDDGIGWIEALRTAQSRRTL